MGGYTLKPSDFIGSDSYYIRNPVCNREIPYDKSGLIISPDLHQGRFFTKGEVLI
jgi:hypothetical protein